MTTTELIESFFPQSPFRRGFPVVEGHLKVDITEADDGFVVKADVPGIDKKGLDVQFHDNVLTITATVENEAKTEKGEEGSAERVLHRERFSGRYERSFKFGKEVDPDNVKAKLDDGVLTINIAKRDPEVAKKERSVTID